MQSNYIVVEGNIGVGKTTLAQKLSDYLEAQLVLETFSDNPYLSKFYQNSKDFALPTELWFFMERYEQLKVLDYSNNKIVADYSSEKSNIFSGINLTGEDQHLFDKITENIKERLPKPDLFIYLHAPIAQLKNNIKQRGRAYEQNISNSYLEQIQNAYQSVLKSQNKVLIIEMTNVDFEKENHFKQVVDFLEKGYDFFQHILNIE
ncbi:MAG TPA: deoxynucleoside kinase [Edaphocola sp.]|nr:deoxynucleoside kinase [Edaphocola sp.]